MFSTWTKTIRMLLRLSHVARHLLDRSSPLILCVEKNCDENRVRVYAVHFWRTYMENSLKASLSLRI